MLAGVRLYRLMLLTSVATGLIGAFLDSIFPGLVPQSLSQAFEALPETPLPMLIGASALFVITFGGTIAAIVGLYFFQPWSRRLAVAMTLLSLLFYPLLGASIESGWARALLELSTTLWGAVVAMSYVSSLSAHFEAKSPVA